ncbi:MAG: hypothetical protein ABL995_16645 [Bryobacteraceae bacterium]
MFHWICPECGREIAPTVRECPVCDPASGSAELVHAGVVEAPVRTQNANPASAPHATVPPANLTDSPAMVPSVVQTASDVVKAPEKAVRPNGRSGHSRSFFLRRPATVAEVTVGAVTVGALAVAEVAVAEVPAAEVPAAEVPAVDAEPPTKDAADKPTEAATPQTHASDTTPVETKQVGTPAPESTPVDLDATKAMPIAVAQVPVVESNVAASVPVPAPVEVPVAKAPEASEESAEASLEAKAPDTKTPETKIPESKEPEVPVAASVTTTQPVAKAMSEAVKIPVAHSAQPSPAAPSIDELEPILPVLDGIPMRSALDSMVAAMGLLPEGESLDDAPALPDPPMQGAVPLAGVRSVPPAVHSLIRELSPHVADGNISSSVKPSVVAAPQETKQPWSPAMQTKIEMVLRPASPVLTAVAVGVRPGRIAQGRIIPPNTPVRYAAPPIARMKKYSPFTKNPLRPRNLKQSKLQADGEFRITLAGPMLTPRLVKFSDRELTAVFPEAKRYQKRSISSWLLAAALGGSLVFAGYSGVFSAFIPRSNADTRVETPVEAAMTRTTGSSPVARAVEVTGFRVLMEPSKKSEIQYLVVNHSGQKFADAVVYVTLFAANAKPGDTPLCKFNFLAPDLGPYQSREMSSSIERVNRPVTVPDWQNLRAEVEVRP